MSLAAFRAVFSSLEATHTQCITVKRDKLLSNCYTINNSQNLNCFTTYPFCPESHFFRFNISTLYYLFVCRLRKYHRLFKNMLPGRSLHSSWLQSLPSWVTSSRGHPFTLAGNATMICGCFIFLVVVDQCLSSPYWTFFSWSQFLYVWVPPVFSLVNILVWLDSARQNSCLLSLRNKTKAKIFTGPWRKTISPIIWFIQDCTPTDKLEYQLFNKQDYITQ